MKKFKFKFYKKKSGTLTPFSFKKDFPIIVKRIFIINGKKNFINLFFQWWVKFKLVVFLKKEKKRLYSTITRKRVIS